MSGPFVYQPPTSPAAYTAPQFQRTPYTHTPRSSTPFIPDSALYPSSPYSRPSSLNPSPNRGAVPLPPERYPFPAAQSAYEAGYGNFWEPRRQRIPSWNGGNQTPWYNAPPPFSAPVYDAGGPGSAFPQRRHSFSSVNRPSSASLQIHPLLNAQAPDPNFFFDLSLPTPEPLLYYGAGQRTRVAPEVLAQPVTYPPVTRLRIVSDSLPQKWDITFDLPPEEYEFYVRTGYEPPPVTAQDVLQELHRHMQTPISHDDWAKLSRAETESVRRAFTRRCRAAPDGYDGYQAERARGVKRVDYLGGRTRFVGLLKVEMENGCEVVKFVTTDPYQLT
ncbi:hypothetical protein C0995_003389 [Termitomyces sp. Mi166|nr:hypothetical protein C0995_003389 [Termitomyces sp. Mi166\